jgi:DnaJ-class molecular chaperone
MMHSLDDDDIEIDEDDHELCHTCNGSGEGVYEDTRCHNCSGTGDNGHRLKMQERKELEADDYRDRERDNEGD